MRRWRLGRIAGTLLLFFLMCPAIEAVAGSRVLRGLQIDSPALGRAIPYTVYLPAVRPDGPARWPVLYLLHGLGDDENAWLDQGAIAATLDRKMATGAMPPAIVVMPMAGRSWYVDDARSNGYGPMARALTTDFIAAIDARFPTVACRAARAIGGLSMGGYGAVLYAFERPDLFAAAFSLSGSLFTEVPPLMLARRRERGERGELFGGVYGEPFDNARFQAWTVFARLDRLVAAAQRPALWLAAGDDDFPSILSGTVRLHQELKRRGIASTLRIDDASHDWTYWRAAADAALSWLSPRLASSCTPAP